ncbi:uncharacterized protein DSM5745_04628 [Aspergillus mulundensis]|uniref:Uncharacterized protein n=1 Tax=Aspergillus mulundensis TaxID=1810919 RepID=A0A3D8S4N3_9EURO|nr:Uncharacterized protein DSM5745_04628 [Aspergillus mulundensis]RDW81071.1 Uncharacterized protein DSM5745_04628 [Aspergillus mulundensis]
MSTLRVPERGLSLHRDSPGDDTGAKSTQIMRLDFAQNTLDELIESLRADQPARIRLGKHQTLYYGSNKSQQFHSSPESHRSEIYTNNSTDDGKLYFTGVLSHSLEVQKAQEATAATDQALANLEQSLSAFERGKESKKTHMITDISEVKALRAGDSRAKAALLARIPSSKVELEKDRLLKTKPNSNRSVSSSPALGVARSPVSMLPLTPTSAPPSQNKDRLRLEALKIPFIHLLAIRAVSTKFLARQTRSSIEDCAVLAQKYGVENRINPEKFDLRDKVYRELDVWKFPYPSQEDRQEAIENAISAFDRMRISRSDKLWQSLLPKEERGKGKCLSRLNLQTGPIKKPLTPRIQISDETGENGNMTSQEAEKSAATAPKSAMNTQKNAKRPAAKGKTAVNSTLTGRVTKKSDKKPPSKSENKFKSAEYVHDSDDDETDLPDVSSSEKSQPLRTQPKPKPKPTPKVTESKAPKEPSHVPTPKVDHNDAPAPKSDISSNSKPTAAKRPPSSLPSSQKPTHKATTLASSPTKTSDPQSRSRSSSQNNTSSSSSPLISQISRPRIAAERPTAKLPAKPNGIARAPETTNSLKRKAELERPSIQNSRLHDDLDHKRRRAVSASSGSTGSASPPLSRELHMRQLREKSQKFKQFYAKYRSLHDAMAAHPDPPRAELEKLQKQHVRLQRMKKEIWDEDRRLRDGL